MHIRYLKNLSFFWLYLALSTCLVLPAHALNSEFQNFSMAQGLSQSTVSDIIEDKRGFMWFATFNGLNRFDGYEFKQYLHTPKIKGSLPDNLIKQLILDSEGNLWIGTLSGLARYDEKLDIFITYNRSNSSLQNNDILTLALNAMGQLLVADDKNLYLYEAQTDTFVVMQTIGASLPPEIKFIFSEKDKTWIGSLGHGIFILDNQTNYLYSLKDTNPWNVKVSATHLFDLLKTGSTYWLATNLGAYKYQSDNFELTHIDTNSRPAIVGGEVRSLAEDHLGRIWFATTMGLSVLDPKDES
ncbi:ligand-binding sensor domain-containing protein, partial [Paraglaciecola hydrolytica]|uniref:ligand-binding sensor domain-containing protein n=1 Tax=Paraglaciecola hydrolytica TaxID=1799789 RepID=UPI002E13AC67